MCEELGNKTDNQFKYDLRTQRDLLQRLKRLVPETEELKEFHKEVDIELKKIRESLED